MFLEHFASSSRQGENARHRLSLGDLSGRTGLPPVGWSSAKASARLLGDHAAMPGSAAGGSRETASEGHDRFGQCNGRLVKVGGMQYRGDHIS